MDGEQKPGWYFLHAQYDLNLRILRMLEGIFFSLDAAYLMMLFYISQPLLGTLEGLCSVIVAFPGYIHNLFSNIKTHFYTYSCCCCFFLREKAQLQILYRSGNFCFLGNLRKQDEVM